RGGHGDASQAGGRGGVAATTAQWLVAMAGVVPAIVVWKMMWFAGSSRSQARGAAGAVGGGADKKRGLIKCGWVGTLHPKIGDMKGAELLFAGNTIEAAGRSLNATADEVIDASDKIVMPGLVNAHMHTWESALRGIGAEWMSADYFKHVHSNLATRYQPEDNYVANLMGALAQIDAGVTTLVDWCHNITTLEHAERAV